MSRQHGIHWSIDQYTWHRPQHNRCLSHLEALGERTYVGVDSERVVLWFEGEGAWGYNYKELKPSELSRYIIGRFERWLKGVKACRHRACRRAASALIPDPEREPRDGD